jgi:hypothetical protein
LLKPFHAINHECTRIDTNENSETTDYTDTTDSKR